MRKSVFLITRYSVVGKAQHTWNLAREANSHSEYKAQLLSPERLRARLAVFRAVTIPSVLAQFQSSADIHWIILVAAELPAKELAALERALSPVERSGVRVSLAKVAASDEAADLEKGVYPGMGMAARLTITDTLAGNSALFASVRLDDDDALAAGYLSGLCDYLEPEFVGKHVTFSRGLQAIYNGPRRPLTDARVIEKPLIALGLAFVNYFDGHEFKAAEVHVLNFGNHTDIINRTEVVSDESEFSYLRVLTNTSDLGDAQHPRNRAANPAEIAALGLPIKIKPPKKNRLGSFVRP